MADGLQIHPSELKFRFELKKNIPVTVSLHNPTGERIAFKVKTTSPKKYCVRPSSGFAEPNSTKDVQVIMQAQREAPAVLGESKDKFLIQWVKAQEDATEVTPELFDPAKSRDIRQIKLRVSLTGPPKPPSPVPEGVEEEPSPIRNTFKEAPPSSAVSAAPVSAMSEDSTSLLKERNSLRQELTHSQRERQELQRRVEMLGTSGGKQTQKVIRGGFNIIHLFLVAIIAFILGHFL